MRIVLVRASKKCLIASTGPNSFSRDDQFRNAWSLNVQCFSGPFGPGNQDVQLIVKAPTSEHGMWSSR
jgi:hypothetical protein